MTDTEAYKAFKNYLEDTCIMLPEKPKLSTVPTSSFPSAEWCSGRHNCIAELPCDCLQQSHCWQLGYGLCVQLGETACIFSLETLNCHFPAWFSVEYRHAQVSFSHISRSQWALRDVLYQQIAYSVGSDKDCNLACCLSRLWVGRAISIFFSYVLVCQF